MKCNKAQEWLSLEMDGQLAPEHVPLLQQHLSGCTACCSYRDELTTGQRLLRATAPALSENFDWKLQLRLNRALREAAREASYPWPRPAASWRTWVARAGFSATVGLAAVLALALLAPANVSQLSDRQASVAGADQSSRLPLQEPPRSAPIFDTTRRPLDASYAASRQQSRLGLQQRVSSSGLSGPFWSGANESDLLRIRQLEQDVEALRRRLLARERQYRLLEAKLDSVTAPVVDRTSQE